MTRVSTSGPDLADAVAGWRRAFRADRDAIDAAQSLSVEERGARIVRLNDEVASTERLLGRLAHEEHVRPQPLVVSPYDARRLVGMPQDVEACVFALDGVLVPSADLHVEAWTETFDELLLARAERTHAPFRPFDPRLDYRARLHGRPRLDGVRAFLESRGIRLPEGTAADAPGSETVNGLANRKSEALLRLLERHGVVAFAGSRSYLELAREAGIRCAVVSASANARKMLDRASLADLVDFVVDGEAIRREHLRIKPAPDTLSAACREVSADPRHTVAFETSRSGVAAARQAGCGLVVGVEGATGADARDELRATGAHLVVGTIAELLERSLAA